METVKIISQAIAAKNGKAYLCGGIVRDDIIGCESKDIDIEVYNLDPEALVKILSDFGTVKLCGKKYGVYKLGNYDFSLPRTETKTGVGHKAFDIVVDPSLSIRAACRRRDLRMNAMLKDPISGEIIDPFGGLQDIKDGIIRHVDNTSFIEDPLRVLRVAQFTARFGFKVHKETSMLCEELLHELPTLSKEPIMEEIRKILLRSEKPSGAFRWMQKRGILDILFPELAALVGIDQGTKHHAEGDAFQHTMLALDVIPMAERTLKVMLGVLSHDLGKAAIIPQPVPEESHVRFHGHDKAGVEVAQNFLHRFTDDNELIADVLKLVEYHMQPYFIKDVNTRVIRRLSLRIDIPSLLAVHKADVMGRIPAGNAEDKLRIANEIASVYEQIKNETKPLIGGDHLIKLGLKPGPKFKNILDTLFEAQIDETFTTVEEGIELAKQIIIDCPN